MGNLIPNHKKHNQEDEEIKRLIKNNIIEYINILKPGKKNNYMEKDSTDIPFCISKSKDLLKQNISVFLSLEIISEILINVHSVHMNLNQYQSGFLPKFNENYYLSKDTEEINHQVSQLRIWTLLEFNSNIISSDKICEVIKFPTENIHFHDVSSIYCKDSNNLNTYSENASYIDQVFTSPTNIPKDDIKNFKTSMKSSFTLRQNVCNIIINF